MLRALLEEDAEFLIVGAHALAIHGVARSTGDLDVWVRPTKENAERVLRALEMFGAPLGALAVTLADLSTRERVIQFGVPPRRIDVLTQITGVDFDDAFSHRVERKMAEMTLPFLGLEAYKTNKRAVGRDRDLADLTLLSRATDSCPEPQG